MLWAPDETALDLFARHVPRSFRTGLRFLDAPVCAPSGAGGGGGGGDGYRPRQVVELCGSAAGPPKMEILLHVVAAFLEHDGQSRVFLFDHEYEASPARLVDILAARIQEQSTSDAGASPTDTAREMATRVVVCHCRDTFELLATLNQVHCRLLDEAPARKRACVGTYQVWGAITNDPTLANSAPDGVQLHRVLPSNGQGRLAAGHDR